ncbi:AzlD family protein [Neisseria sp. Dent CA1/247]|uniref:AzlD family protein n=1 Tax=Neisseria sp. Dent CA1/247 TaxID=2912675 RepID=UPI001FD17C15|nr:AzlD family protein [Neisseria sp. Dent CA1/247]UOO77997.1 AzlD family protein [Neisseria sp. Dent CA1/247]
MISWASFTVVMGMLAATYSTRLIGFFMLRNRTLSPRAAAVMDAAPGCVLIAVIAPYFASGKPHELVALAVTILAASRWGMLPTVLIAVASAAILGRWMN